MVDSTTSNVNLNTESNQVGDEGVRETQTPNQAAAAAAAAAAGEAAAASAATAAAAAAQAAAAVAVAAESADEAEEKEILKMKKTMKSHLIVAALIATVTFGAGFTLPGGYIQNQGNDQGMAVLSLPTNGNEGNDRLMEIASRKSFFRFFVVADSTAMILSICAIGIYFLASLPFKNKRTIRLLVMYGYRLTVFAMIAMVGAFVAGLNAVLYPSSLLKDATTFILLAFLLLFGVPGIVIFVVNIGKFGW